MVKTNVDMILDTLRQRKSSTVNDLSRQLAIPQQDIQKSAEYLEEEGIVRIEYKFPNTVVTLVKDISADILPQTPAQPAAPAQAARQFSDEPAKVPTPAGTAQEMESVNPFSKILSYTTGAGSPKPGALAADVTAPASSDTAASITQQGQQGQEGAQLSLPGLFSEQTKDPFDVDKPKFYMRPPDPVSHDKFPDLSTDDSPGGIDRIEAMLDIIEKRIAAGEYKNLNVLYRKVYDLFTGTDSLTPNERMIIAERINSVFSKAKRIYAAGNVVI